MTNAITPPPWYKSRDAVPDWHVQITVYAESDGQRVATVFQSEANADLFVAAPDLLAACEAALAAMEAQFADDPVAALQMEWDAEPMPQLRTAIAKAKGDA